MKDEKYWEDLGRRAVACEGWRWMPGMLARRWVELAAGLCLNRLRLGESWNGRHEVETSAWPDFRDPATVGCLLALVREKRGVPSLVCGHVGGWDDDWDTWEVSNPPGRGHGCCLEGRGETEAEALVAALEQVER